MMVAMEPEYAVTAQPAYCGARRKQQADPETVARCTRPAGWGTDHLGVGACKLHGGCTPTGRKHAQRLVAAMLPQALAELQRLLNNPDMKDETKLRVIQDVLDRNGIVSPKRVEHTGADGAPITHEVRVAEVLERLEALDAGTVIDTTATEGE